MENLVLEDRKVGTETTGKTTFEKYNPDVAGVTKEVNGLTLVWDEGVELFVLPVGKKSPFQIIFDEPSGQLIQVQNADFIYRDRRAESPDGTKIQERVFIGRIPKKKPGTTDIDFEEIFLPDPDVQKAIIRAKVLELKKVFIEHLLAVNRLFLVGSVVSIVFFFWYLITGLDILAAALTIGAAPALGEVGYLLVWGVGLVGLGFLAKYTVPALLRRRNTDAEYETEYAGRESAQNTTINVNVNQGNRTSGDNGAQGYVNNRQL